MSDQLLVLVPLELGLFPRLRGYNVARLNFTRSRRKLFATSASS